MTPQEWIKKHRIIQETKDWDSLDELRVSGYQDFAYNSDLSGLYEFYNEVLNIALTCEESKPFFVMNDDEFRKIIKESFTIAKQRIKRLGNIKGVYIEYYYDNHKGDSSNSANLFLCESYSTKNDEWASDFENEGFITGALLPDYFYHNYEWFMSDEIEEQLKDIAHEAYAHARLLALIIEEWKLSGITGIPLGFARHDYGIVRIKAN